MGIFIFLANNYNRYLGLHIVLSFEALKILLICLHNLHSRVYILLESLFRFVYLWNQTMLILGFCKKNVETKLVGMAKCRMASISECNNFRNLWDLETIICAIGTDSLIRLLPNCNVCIVHIIYSLLRIVYIHLCRNNFRWKKMKLKVINSRLM